MIRSASAMLLLAVLASTLWSGCARLGPPNPTPSSPRQRATLPSPTPTAIAGQSPGWYVLHAVVATPPPGEHVGGATVFRDVCTAQPYATQAEAEAAARRLGQAREWHVVFAVNMAHAITKYVDPLVYPEWSAADRASDEASADLAFAQYCR